MPLQPLSTIDREDRLLAPCAFRSADSAGRVHPEPTHRYRGPFQRDRDRIVHSSGYRRLAHKTQVFTGEMGDYHRTRLTHTLEVASIGRTIGRELRLNEDLIESLALLHDVGHPPFGHAGEKVLDGCLRDWGGFNHNRQALRLVELLETRYPEFPGLNLSVEVLAGQRLRAVQSEARKGRARTIEPYGNPDCKSTALGPNLLEFQVVDAADSIAYDTHDADDALALGLLELGQLLEVSLWRDAARQVHIRYTSLDQDQLRRATVHQLIEMLVSDLLISTQTRILDSGLHQGAAEAGRSGNLVGPSPEITEKKRGLEEFLFTHVYRHPALLARRKKTNSAFRHMFGRIVSRPEQMPEEFLRLADRDGLPRSVGDYLSCLTDRSAQESLRRM